MKKKIRVIKAIFCNKKCKSNYRKWRKKEINARQFAIISSLQHRCSYCGVKLFNKKTVNLV